MNRHRGFAIDAFQNPSSERPSSADVLSDMRLFAPIFCALVAAILASPLRADPPAVRGTPPPLSRTIRIFDFEERARGNVEDTPEGWLKVEGPGLPRYLNGTFDDTVSSGGRTSFRFDLNGGSVTYRYPAGKIPVMEHAAYRVTAMVRTTPLKYARARVTAYFCDIDGHVISSSIRATEPFANDADDQTFHLLNLSLTATEAEAASVVVELALLQPSLLPDDKLGGQKLPVEDIRGSAWFDDVRIAQVPDVSVRTDRATNVFSTGEPVNIRLQIRDRIATDLTGELRVGDVDGKPIFQRTGAIDFAGDDPAKPLLATIPLPRLDPGWYEARLTIRSHEDFVSEHAIRFVQLGPGLPVARADPRFGIIATDCSPELWPLLPEAMDELAAGRVKLSAWSEKYAIDSAANADGFDKLLDNLKRRGVAITAVLSHLPPEVAKSVGGDQWTDLLKVSPDRWQTQLAFLLARHATHLTRWQLMDDDAAPTLASEAGERDVFQRVQDEFTKLIGSPDLAMPWPAWFELQGYVPPHVALVVPPEVLPEQLPLYIADLKSQPDRSVSLTLQPIDRGRYGRLAQMRDLALRVANALAGGAESIDLPLPMTTSRRRDGDAYAEPDKLLVAQRVITASLSNARYAGKVAIAQGIDAFLFDRGGPDGGVMLVYSRDQSPTAAIRHVPITLGKRATLIDLDGNATTLAHVSTPDRKRPDDFDLPVGAMPVFVTDVDAPLLMLRAGMALDNPMLESSFRTHGRKLSFKNTFDEPITGSVKLTGPDGWTVQTPNMTFSLNPGETFDAPVTIEFPLNSPAGDKTLNADLRIEGHDDYRLNVPIAAKLGLSDVGLQTVAVRSGNELIVQQMITNYGSVPISYTAFISMPGQARQERLVTNIGPGKTTIRKYRLAAPVVPGPVKLRSGLRELQGKRMLNEEVDVN